MKLSELPDRLFQLITQEEKDLELKVEVAMVQVILRRKEEIVIHKWRFGHKPGKEEFANV